MDSEKMKIFLGKTNDFPGIEKERGKNIPIHFEKRAFEFIEKDCGGEMLIIDEDVYFACNREEFLKELNTLSLRTITNSESGCREYSVFVGLEKIVPLSTIEFIEKESRNKAK